MSDVRWEIVSLLYSYAELLDAGDFEGVADLFADATLTAEGRSMHRVGRDDVLAMYTDNTRRYPEIGTPRTKHVTTNPIVTVDEAAGRAHCRSYCTVFQAVPGMLTLQPIWAGRYHDDFELVDGRWRFAHRHFIADLEGDLSQHLRPGIDRQ